MAGDEMCQQKRGISVFDDPPRKNVLLLSCMDQRLLDDTVWFMNSLNLQNRYDQVALAGSSMGARQLPENLPYSERWRAVFFVHLKSAIDVLHRPIKDVFLLDHLDCGAYKYLHPCGQIQEEYRKASLGEMAKYHHEELYEFSKEVKDFIKDQHEQAQKKLHAARKACKDCGEDEDRKEEKTCWEHVKELAKEKAEAWSEIRVSYFVMDLLGVVRQFDVLDGGRDTLGCSRRIS